MAESRHLIIGNTNKRINELISTDPTPVDEFTCHFNQSEEMFLKFDTPLRVPSLPIHHDVRDPEPSREYLNGVYSVIENVLISVPGLVNNLKYYFDPGDVHRPTFYQVFKIGDSTYCYLLKFDLTFHPSYHRVLTQGSNDWSPEYETNRLIVEADILPIASISKTNGFHSLEIEKSISETWIGETGRGYFVQGIWLDRELTKFFSKLFLDEQQKTYPFYPISCKYQAICQSLNVFSPQARKQRIATHHSIRKFLLQYIQQIETALRHEEFSTDLPAYKMIREKVPAELRKAWMGTSVEIYLNDSEMREYRIKDAMK